MGVRLIPHKKISEEGERIILECLPTDSRALIEWTRSEFEIPEEVQIEDKRLVIDPSKVTSAGFYICRVVGAPRGSQNFGQVAVRTKRSSMSSLCFSCKPINDGFFTLPKVFEDSNAESHE